MNGTIYFYQILHTCTYTFKHCRDTGMQSGDFLSIKTYVVGSQRTVSRKFLNGTMYFDQILLRTCTVKHCLDIGMQNGGFFVNQNICCG